MPYTVYILQSDKDGSYYIGQTNNIDGRISRHNAKRSRATKSGVPWKLVYQEVYQSRSEAVKREQKIKNKESRKYIEYLVNKNISKS